MEGNIRYMVRSYGGFEGEAHIVGGLLFFLLDILHFLSCTMRDGRGGESRGGNDGNLW